MDVMLAAYRMVHDWPGGAAVLAPVVGKNPTTLAHEVSPQRADAKFGLADAVAISEWTRDTRVLTAFAARMGAMVIPLPPIVSGAATVASRTAALAREFGELMAEVSVDIGDGKVSDNERARIEREAGQLVAALQQLLASVQALNARRPTNPAAATV